MLFFQGPATLEEAGEVLRAVGQPSPIRCGEGALTRALAMLAFSRLNSVVTPTSECRTSCTRCCVCESWGSARCSGDAGAAMSSMGETGAASSFGPAAVGALKSGLKLSLLAMGGMEGGAAIVGVVDVMTTQLSAEGIASRLAVVFRHFSPATLASLVLSSFNVRPLVPVSLSLNSQGCEYILAIPLLPTCAFVQ